MPQNFLFLYFLFAYFNLFNHKIPVPLFDAFEKALKVLCPTLLFCFN